MTVHRMHRDEASGEAFRAVDATRVRGRAHGMDVYVTSAMIDDQVERLASSLRSLERLLHHPG